MDAAVSPISPTHTRSRRSMETWGRHVPQLYNAASSAAVEEPELRKMYWTLVRGHHPDEAKRKPNPTAIYKRNACTTRPTIHTTNASPLSVRMYVWRAPPVADAYV